ncbi:MAG: hypothetical protein JNL61_12605 [Rhizobiaceae bacterium]|nr:hypothetical protein [Rhizobiaceae bacterium]
MFRGGAIKSTILALLATGLLAGGPAVAQDAPAAQKPGDEVPGLSSFAPSKPEGRLTASEGGEVTLVGRLTNEGPEVTRGLVWRIFSPDADADGKLPLVASAQGGTAHLTLRPGGYLVHAAYGRAGATKRITVGKEPQKETLVLNAGGLKLDAILAGGVRIPPSKLRFSIYDADEGPNGDRALVIPDVAPNTVVRLSSGTYHVVSTYGTVNAVIRSDIRVEAGKLTEATVEHKAAELTLKLVREEGGEAIADTSWSILSDSGDPVRESVGAFASMVLAEGDYTIIAKNRDRIYQREFTVVGGRNQEVEVIANEANAQPADEITD